MIACALAPPWRGRIMAGRRLCTTSSAFWYTPALISASVMMSADPRIGRDCVFGCAVVPVPPPPQATSITAIAHITVLRMSTPREAGSRFRGSEDPIVTFPEAEGLREGSMHVSDPSQRCSGPAVAHKGHHHVRGVQGTV